MFACTSRVATSTLSKSRVVARRWASSSGEGTGAAKKATEEVIKKEEPVGLWHSAKCTLVDVGIVVTYTHVCRNTQKV
jgi:hypothetical protein